MGVQNCQYEGGKIGMRSEHAKRLYSEATASIKSSARKFIENMLYDEPLFTATRMTEKKTGEVLPSRKNGRNGITISCDSVTISCFADPRDLKLRIWCNNPECEFWKGGEDANSPARCLLEPPMELPADILEQAQKAKAGAQNRSAEED
ncbi:MAG: hypothetical protein WCT52_00415 [Candidatus Micrarchaeia archaeon]|jgi:hypothetical protein